MARNNNNLNKHICSDKIKWLATLIAILLLAVAVAAACTQGFTNGNPWGWFDKKEDEPGSDAAGGLDVTPEQPEGTGIAMTVKTIDRSEYDDYGIMSIAEGAQQLTATVTPADAEDAVIDWSVAWKSGASGLFGNGKTVTEYVTVTPTSDGAKTANVQCLKAFGEQIIVTAAIRGNAAVKGTATADYQQKFSSVTASIAMTHTTTANNITWTLGSSASVTGAFPGKAKTFAQLGTIYGASASGATYNVTVTTALTDTYTKAATVGATKIEMAPTAAYISAVTGAKGTISQKAGSFLSLGTGTGASSKITGFDFSKALMISTGTSMDWTGFKRNLKGQASTKMFDIKLTTTVNGQAQTKTYALTFDASTFGSFASGVTVGPALTF